MLLNLESIPHSYKNYVKQVEESDLLQALRISGHRALELVHAIPESKIDFRYAEGKWSIREVLCHMIDAERIFSYRALRFGRNDQTPLRGFEENEYATQANASGRSIQKITAEMSHLRSATIDLFEGFTPEMLTRKGKVNTNELSAAAWAFIIAGHETHHCNILKERYLAVK